MKKRLFAVVVEIIARFPNLGFKSFFKKFFFYCPSKKNYLANL
jgi:hypothetical protein